MKISEYFEQDHDRLDDLFRNFQEWKSKDYPRAKEYFVAFKFGLQRHIVWEEEILFPFFEKTTGVSQGPTLVMRMEHIQIGESLEALHAKVKKADPASDQEENRLLEVLSLHNMKEENVLYPAIDAQATKDDTKSVFDRMSEMPAERFEHCCRNPVPAPE